jgi:hypothetical protein
MMKKQKETIRAIKKGLKNLGVQLISDAQMKKKAFVGQDYFYDYHRSSGSHKPDLFIQQDEKIVPVEVKSESESYDEGRYSIAHLYSFLQRTVYGQCFSYGDLHRDDSGKNHNRMKVILIVPKLVIDEEAKKGLGDIEKVFEIALKPDEICSELMGIKMIRFEAPSFCKKLTKTYGYLVAEQETYLITEIFYEIEA